MRAAPVYLALLFIVAACAEAQSPTEVAGKIDVFDGRAAVAYVDFSEWEAHAAVRSAAQAARAHWRSQDAAFEEEFRVLSVAEGAFTRSGAGQHAILYLMSAEPRYDPKVGFAIVEGTALVRNLAFGSANDLQSIPDLDGDGRNELALLYTYGMGGSSETGLTLASFDEGGVLREWVRTNLADNSCATGSPYAQASTGRLLAAPGPVFMLERYVDAGCEGTWVPAGEAESIEPDVAARDHHSYTDLPVR